jgi:hypothetical protein
MRRELTPAEVGAYKELARAAAKLRRAQIRAEKPQAALVPRPAPVAVSTSPTKPAGQAKRTTARPPPAAGPVRGFRETHVRNVT